MDLQLVKKCLDYTRKKKKWVLLLASLGFTSYGFYRFYHSPSIARKRERLFQLSRALISFAEAVSDSSEVIGIVSKDLRLFLRSDSDQIPPSLKQLSKIIKSKEFYESLSIFTGALIVGILSGYRSGGRNEGNEITENSGFSDQVMDRLFTTDGSGFASAVVGSFARNLVMGFYSEDRQSTGRYSSSNDSGVVNGLGVEDNESPRWVNLICSAQGKEFIGDCIQSFVSNAVAIYLEKTMDINTYDEIFSGLTNPNHETRVRDVLISVCNGAVETLVKTSHQVLTSSNSGHDSSLSSSGSAIDQGQVVTGNVLSQEASTTDLTAEHLPGEVHDSGWVSKVSTTLAVPSNRKFVLDVTGRVTFETVRSLLEFFLEKLYDVLKSFVDFVYETTLDQALQVVRYVTENFSVIVTIWLSVFLHILNVNWVSLPA